jgi:hypothetical protein
LFEGGFEVFDDFLGKDVGIGEIVDSLRLRLGTGIVDAGLVAVDTFFVTVSTLRRCEKTPTLLIPPSLQRS